MTKLTRAQAAALTAAAENGAVCGHTRWTYTTGTLEALERRGLLARVPAAETRGDSRAWYRPTAAGRRALAEAGPHC